MIEISFIIVNWNTRDLLRCCLNSIYRSADRLTHEIIVIDNGSLDGSAEMVAGEFPHVLLVHNDDNLGFARGANQGLRISSGRYIFLLNSDVELMPSTLPALTQVMDKHPSAGIAGCAQQHIDGEQIIAFYDDPTLLRELGRNLFLIDYIGFRLRRRQRLARRIAPAPVDWVMGAALFVRRETLESVGLLDESVFMYGEEFDWCYRARQRGWQVFYVPEARVVHHENQSGVQQYNTRRYAAVTRSLFYFYDKHFGVMRRRILAAIHVVGSVIRLMGWAAAWLVSRDRRQARAGLSEHWHVLRVAWEYMRTNSKPLS